MRRLAIMVLLAATLTGAGVADATAPRAHHTPDPPGYNMTHLPALTVQQVRVLHDALTTYVTDGEGTAAQRANAERVLADLNQG